MKRFALFLVILSLIFACAAPVKNEAVATLAPTATTPVVSAPAVTCDVCTSDCDPDCTPPIVECPPNTGMDAACLADFEHLYVAICYFHFEEAQKCCDTAGDNWIACLNSCPPNDPQCAQACVDAFNDAKDKCNNEYNAQKDFDQDLFISLILEHCCLPNLVAQGIDVTDVAAMEEYRMSLMSTAFELFRANQSPMSSSH